MSKNKRTVWTEGMFLGPQHFQQHDRYVLNTLSGSHHFHGKFSYGLTQCVIDNNALAEGKFALLSVKGVFSDGTPFSLPENDDLPEPINISVDTRDQLVCLAIPFVTQSDKDVAEIRSSDNFSRYLLDDQTVIDRHSPDSHSEETVFIAGLWTRLVLESSGASAFHTIPIARIIEKREDDMVRLDNTFYPCAASLQASPQLLGLCKEINGLLHQRSKELASKLGTPNASDTSQLVQLLLLQTINRFKPLFQHIAQCENDHPERLFRELIQLAGELATLSQTNRLPENYPDYLHREQYTSFSPVIDSIRFSLNWIPDSTTESIAVTHVKAGVYTATVHDKHLFDSARFILAVRARVAPDELQRLFPRQTIVSSKQHLKGLVESQSSGVELSPMVTVPNSIPMFENHVYFELQRDNQLWSEIALTGDIAFHIAGKYTDLSMQLWTIGQ